MSDLISVIVPVFRTEKYIERCLKSILNQTYDNIEIIVVDDGTDDNAGIIADKYAETEPRIRVVHKKNGGLSSARNRGIEEASGKYISYVDSDDFIAKDFIEVLYSNLISNDCDIAKVEYEEVTFDEPQDREASGETKVYEGSQVEKAFLDLNIDSCCDILYKKELIGKTRFPEGRTSEDIPYNFEIFRKAIKFVNIPVVKYFYYHNPESISNGPLDKNMLNYVAFRKMIYEYYLNGNNEELEIKSESLYARSLMGLTARMCLYGFKPEIDEKKQRLEFKQEFVQHKHVYYNDKDIPLSRKILAVGVFNFYPITRLFRGIAK